MAITATEKHASRSGDGTAATLLYDLKGSSDYGDVRAALLAAAPATFEGLNRLDKQARADPILIDTSDEAGCLWEGKVEYGVAEEEVADPVTGSDEEFFQFDTSGRTIHVNQTLETVYSDAVDGTAPDTGGAIGVTDEGVEGVDIEEGGFDFSVRAYFTAAQVTAAYLGGLKALSWHVNSTTYTLTIDGESLSFAAGECLFKHATGSKRRKGDYEITFHFSGAPNVSNLVVGSMTNIPKKGHEYVWARYRKVESQGAVMMEPMAVYVERVRGTADLSGLGIGVSST